MVGMAMLVGTGVAACGASDGAPAGGSNAQSGETGEAVAPAAHPDPVASITVGNGKTVEFFDLGAGGVLVMESGKAEGDAVLQRTPGIQEMLDANRFADVFAALRPDLPVPDSLRELAARPRPQGAGSLAVAPSVARSGGGAPLEEVTAEETGRVARPMTDNCGNGCCNYSWLTSNICPTDDDWFYMDYGWSWHNAGGAQHWGSTACAARGQSQLTVTVQANDGQHGGSWSVPQGNYNHAYWNGGFLNYASITSTVNSSSNQHDHTYCGADS
jgi:hypothetical protein